MIKTFNHLKSLDEEGLKAYFGSHAVTAFDRARIAFMRGDIRAPNLSSVDFDRICSDLGLSYKALSAIIGVSDQCLMRYRKKNDFPRWLAYMMRLLETRKDGYFSLFFPISKDVYIPINEEILVKEHDSGIVEKRLLDEKLKNPFHCVEGSLESIKTMGSYMQSAVTLKMSVDEDEDSS